MFVFHEIMVIKWVDCYTNNIPINWGKDGIWQQINDQKEIQFLDYDLRFLE